MKRYALLILATFYLLISSGVTVNVHYCMGKLASLGLLTHDSKKCSNCGMDNSGCCKDEVKILKIQDNQNTTSSFVAIPKVAVSIPSYTADVPQTLALSRSIHSSADHSPPLSGHSFQSLFCIYRV